MEKLDHEVKTSDLDFKKLLGFRNLVPVTKPESDLEESSDLAFSKKGAPEDGTTF